MTITYQYRHLGKPNPVHRATEPATAPIGQEAPESAAPNEYPSLWARIKKVEYDNNQAAARIDELESALKEAGLQIEYLHGKFQPTGTGEAMLARINQTLGEGR